MPVVTATNAQTKTDRTGKTIRERHGDKLDGVPKAAAAAAQETNDAVTDLTEQQMLNLPRGFRVGGIGWKLTCPVIARAGALQAEIITYWPDPIVIAAQGDPSGEGLDAGLLAATLNALYRGKHEDDRAAAAKAAKAAGRAPQTIPEPAAIGERDAAVLLYQASLVIPDLMPTLCDHVWQMASETPGLAWPKPQPPPEDEGAPAEDEDEDREAPEWKPEPPPGCEWLDDAISARFRAADFADLLRAMLLTMGGFPGDVIERYGAFTAPV